MEERPKIKIKPTPFDKVLELFGLLSLALLWAITLINYAKLPDTIAVHFNAAGLPDSFGSKITLLILPILGTIIFLGLTVLIRFTYLFNYPTRITTENAESQYRIAARLIRYLKFALVLVFTFIVFKTIQTAEGKSDGLGFWFLPLTLGIIFVPLGYITIQSFKQK
ncbi:MAG: DUF1648 domain-containing protein [Prolixibacteraceae bacterium]